LALSSSNELFYWGQIIKNGTYFYSNVKDSIFKPIILNINEYTKNKKIKLISASKRYFSIIVLENEEIYIIGSFLFEKVYLNFPRLINNKGVLKDKKIKDISTGGNFVLILCEDNTLISFGDNSNGQLGDNTTRLNSFDPILVYQEQNKNKNIKQISSGFFHSLILTDQNKVFSFGGNLYGQIGDGTTIDRYFPVDIFLTESLKKKKIILVSTGYYHSFALTNENFLIAWGDNRFFFKFLLLIYKFKVLDNLEIVHITEN
jgi:alpha-tubulin suppressor-like RCC1 family protein